ncbi:MAG TPA: ribosome maturation factor RimP [bacterium]|nr:ribosome maturation factor RimP [bacterium]
MAKTRSLIAEQVADLARPIAARWGLDLVDVEVLGEGPRTVVRVLADGIDGVTVNDLARVSEALSGQLDAHDLIAHAYTLEVSSPGLDRPLRSEADFARFAGRSVEIWVDPPLEGRRHFKGRLLGLRGIGGQEVELELGAGAGTETVRLARDRVTAARLVVDQEMLKQDLAKGGRRDG